MVRLRLYLLLPLGLLLLELLMRELLLSNMFLLLLLELLPPNACLLKLMLLYGVLMLFGAQLFKARNVFSHLLLSPVFHKAKGIVRLLSGNVLLCVCLEMSFSVPRLKTSFVRIIFAARFKAVFKINLLLS